MLTEAKARTQILQQRLQDEGIDRAVFTDESSIAYLSGFWGYLGIEFGRPTMLVVPASEPPIVITPLMDISPILGAMRVIKSPFEINVMKQAGEIAVAMMAAAHK